MRTVVVYELLSLDGVAEGADEFFVWDEQTDANLAAVIASQTTVLLGRATYDEWALFWPGSDIEPFAGFVNGVDKYVATSSPLEPPWRGAEVVDGELVGFVRALRHADGGDIGVHGSISVVQTLLAAGVVDELQLVVMPRVAGRGRRLLDGASAARLELLAGATTSAGNLLLHYRVT